MGLAWYLRHRFEPRARPRLSGFLAITPYFLRESVRGGVDVARLALGPRRHILSHITRFPIAMPPGPVRRALITVVSLLPGTLSAHLDGDDLLVHRVRRGPADDADLRQCERRVARLFKPLPAPAGSQGARDLG